VRASPHGLTRGLESSEKLSWHGSTLEAARLHEHMVGLYDCGHGTIARANDAITEGHLGWFEMHLYELNPDSIPEEEGTIVVCLGVAKRCAPGPRAEHVTEVDPARVAELHEGIACILEHAHEKHGACSVDVLQPHRPLQGEGALGALFQKRRFESKHPGPCLVRRSARAKRHSVPGRNHPAVDWPSDRSSWLLGRISGFFRAAHGPVLPLGSMRLRTLAVTLLLGLLATTAGATEGTERHTVAPGQTLGKIAKRYSLTVEALCAANQLSRTTAIRPGQELIIPARGEGAQIHVVASGDTLGKIAERYSVTLEQLLGTNRLRRTATLKEGQRLVIPTEGGTSEPAAPPEQQEVARETTPSADRDPPPGAGAETLTVGPSGPVYYYRPVGRGRLGLRPVIVYLHGRGGQPAADCQRWAPIARKWGWLVCPSGPEDRGSGRGWANNWAAGHHIVMASVKSLREKFGRRVQLYGNTIVGFSEGAYVAMNVGVREPHVFNRWLILAAKSTYWGGPGLEALDTARHQLKRVFLITGEEDGVVDGTEDALRRLKEAHVPTRIVTPDDMGHEVPLERKASLYQAALRWLEEGKGDTFRSDLAHGRRTASR